MAALNATQIQAAFKFMGKLIFLSQTADAQSIALRTTMAGTVDQASSGSPGDANVITHVAVPVVTRVNEHVKKLDETVLSAKTYVKTYLEKVLAADQGRPQGTGYGVVLTQLAADMVSAAQSVAPSGVSPSGYCTYFANNFGVALPQNASATILDSWINPNPL